MCRPVFLILISALMFLSSAPHIVMGMYGANPAYAQGAGPFIDEGDVADTGIEKKVEAKKGIVAFIEASSADPSDVYLLYPAQYKKYRDSGSLDDVIEFREITWLFYPLPALLEDQTIYIVTNRNVNFNISYEDIQDRIDRLFAGEEQLRAGAEMSLNNGINIIRLSPLIPGLKINLEMTEKSQFTIGKTIDLARYRKGLMDFDQMYRDSRYKDSSNTYAFSTSDYEDMYLFIMTKNSMRLKYMIWATKESAESGC